MPHGFQSPDPIAIGVTSCRHATRQEVAPCTTPRLHLSLRLLLCPRCHPVTPVPIVGTQTLALPHAVCTSCKVQSQWQESPRKYTSASRRLDNMVPRKGVSLNSFIFSFFLRAKSAPGSLLTFPQFREVGRRKWRDFWRAHGGDSPAATADNRRLQPPRGLMQTLVRTRLWPVTCPSLPAGPWPPSPLRGVSRHLSDAAINSEPLPTSPLKPQSLTLVTMSDSLQTLLLS